MSLKLVLIFKLANSADPQTLMKCSLNAAFHLGPHWLPNNPFRSLQYTKGVVNPQTVMLENSEDPAEMQQIVAFHQGLHCSLKTKTIFRD